MNDDALHARKFDEEEVRKILDRLSMAELIGRFGAPQRIVHLAQSSTYWKPGDERPALAADDPAIMQAIGRCAVGRITPPSGMTSARSIHDQTRCGWCEYPVEELIRACEWAQSESRYVLADMAVWHEYPDAQRGAKYVRVPRSDFYQNPAWVAFAQRSRDDQEADVRVGLYGDVR